MSAALKRVEAELAATTFGSAVVRVADLRAVLALAQPPSPEAIERAAVACGLTKMTVREVVEALRKR